jgi:hypothetical protein
MTDAPCPHCGEVSPPGIVMHRIDCPVVNPTRKTDEMVKRGLAAERIREIFESVGIKMELDTITNWPDDGFQITVTFGKEICVTDTTAW